MQKNDVRGMRKMKMQNWMRKYFSMGLHEGVSEMRSDQIDQVIKSIHLKENKKSKDAKSKDAMMKSLFKKQILRIVGISMGLFLGLSSIVYARPLIRQDSQTQRDFNTFVDAMMRNVNKMGPINDSQYSPKTHELEELLRKKMILVNQAYQLKQQSEDLKKRADRELARRGASFTVKKFADSFDSNEKPFKNDVLNQIDHDKIYYKDKGKLEDGQRVEEVKLGLFHLPRSENRHEVEKIFKEHLRSQNLIQAQLELKREDVARASDEIEELLKDGFKDDDLKAVMQNLIPDYGRTLNLNPELIKKYQRRSEGEGEAVNAAQNAAAQCITEPSGPASHQAMQLAASVSGIDLATVAGGGQPSSQVSLQAQVSSCLQVSGAVSMDNLIQCLQQLSQALNPPKVPADPQLAVSSARLGALPTTLSGGDGEDEDEDEYEDDVSVVSEEDELNSLDGDDQTDTIRTNFRGRGSSSVSGSPPPPPPSLFNFDSTPKSSSRRDGSSVALSSRAPLQEYPTVVFRDQDQTHFLKASKLRGDGAGFIFTHNDGTKKDPYLVSSDGTTVLKLKGMTGLVSDTDESTVLGEVTKIAKGINDEEKFKKLFAANKKVSDWIVGDSPGTYYRVEKLDGGKYKLVGFTKKDATVLGDGQVVFHKIKAQGKKALAGEIKKLRAAEYGARSVLHASKTLEVGASKEALALKKRITARDSALKALAAAQKKKQQELTKKIQTLDAAIRGLNSADVADVAITAQIAGLEAKKKEAKEEFARNRDQYRQDKGKINREASAEIDALGLALKKKKAELALKRLPPPQVSFIDDSTLSDPLKPKKEEIAGKVTQIENQQAFLRLKAMIKKDPTIFTEEFKTALKAGEMVIRLSGEAQRANTKNVAEFRKKDAKRKVLAKAVTDALTAAGTTSGSSSLPAPQDLITELSNKARVEPDQETKKALGLQIADIKTKFADYNKVKSELDKLQEVNQAKRASREQAIKAAHDEFEGRKKALATSLNPSTEVNQMLVELMSFESIPTTKPTIHILGSSGQEHVVLMRKDGDKAVLKYTQVLKKAGDHSLDSVAGSSVRYEINKWYKLDDRSYFYVESLDNGRVTGQKYNIIDPASQGGVSSK